MGLDKDKSGGRVKELPGEGSAAGRVLALLAGGAAGALARNTGVPFAARCLPCM